MRSRRSASSIMTCCARNGLRGRHGASGMIEMRRTQLGFGDGLIAAEVSDLREGWMKYADVVLSDEAIVAAVYEALANRHPKSRCRGRRGAPAEMVLRLLILKHIRNWSYEVLEREVRANLVYRASLNAMLKAIGLIPVDWLGSGRTALFVLFSVQLWSTFGMSLLIFMAGLSTVPKELTEA